MVYYSTRHPDNQGPLDTETPEAIELCLLHYHRRSTDLSPYSFCYGFANEAARYLHISLTVSYACVR
jgi:hypothetical protein